MILRPLILTSAKLVASSLHRSSGEFNELSESRFRSGLDEDQTARRRT